MATSRRLNVLAQQRQKRKPPPVPQKGVSTFAEQGRRLGGLGPPTTFAEQGRRLQPQSTFAEQGRLLGKRGGPATQPVKSPATPPARPGVPGPPIQPTSPLLQGRTDIREQAVVRPPREAQQFEQIAGYDRFGRPVNAAGEPIQQFGGDPISRATARGQSFQGQQLERLIEQQRGDFRELSQRFRENLGMAIAPQREFARQQTAQDIGRRGLSFSGVEQARLGQVEAAATMQFARSAGEFEQQLLGAQAQEREFVRKGGFAFVNNLFNAFQQQGIDKEMANFTNAINKDNASKQRWFDIANSIGESVGSIPFA